MTGNDRASRAGSDFDLFAALYLELRRFAAIVGDADMDPDDLVQDALAATLSRHHLHELDAPAAYLRTAIVRTAANRRRKAGRWRAILPSLTSSLASTDAYPSDLAILFELDALDRAIIYLTDVEGSPHEFIASQLGLSPAAVRKRASRARAQLRSLLGPAHSSRERT